MRHEIQRTIAGALLATLTLLANGIATAEGPHERVRGEYRLTFTRTCAVEGPELIVPTGTRRYAHRHRRRRDHGAVHPAWHYPLRRNRRGHVRRPAQFHPGTGPVGTGIATSEGNEIFINQAAVTCALTYAVNPDGSVTQQLNCTVGFTAGPNAGQTATLNGIVMDGQLSPEGNVLLLSQIGTARETFTPNFGPGSGIPQQRICNGSGLAVSLR